MSENKSFHKHVLTNGVMTGTSVIESQITNIRNFDNVSYDIQVTGTPTGAFSVQVSNSYDPITNPNATFIDLALSPSPGVAGTAIEIGIDVNQSGFNWIKIIYTNVSGTGVANVYINGKSI